jgi:hypothetical protein
MAREINLEASKSYATRENARKAIAKYPGIAENQNLRYIIHQLDDGRYIPVFLGQEAIQAGVHFRFHVVG